MKLFDLSGKVALVTGGNGGIGLAMAEAMAGAGADIAVAARNADKGRAAVDKLTALGVKADFIPVDVTDEASIKAMVAAAVDGFGRLDILVNNAGTNIRKRPEALSVAEWHQVIDTNLTSAFIASQAAYVPMCAASGGKVINIGSMMSLAGTGRGAREGTRMGLWGAAQAIAAGFGGLFGAAAADGMRLWITSAAGAFGSVFLFEAALFVLAAAMAAKTIEHKSIAQNLVPGE